MEQRVITVIGGTGFVGRYVVKRLAQAGYTIRVISRNPEAGAHLKTAGDVGQIVLVSGNLAQPQSLAGKIEDSYAIINLAGILFESGRQKFARIHAAGAEKLAQMAYSAGVPRFIHVSALGIDKARGSHYARTKLLGEKAVLSAHPGAVVLRPSVMFGPEDNFFNQFAAMPVLPLIGGGRTKFQPVYVGDIARAIENCLTQPTTAGQTYELGGPHIYSFRTLLEYMQLVLGKLKPMIPLPFALASLIGTAYELRQTFSLGLLKPKLTRDQITLLKHDNIVAPDAKTFMHLGIAPTAVEIVVPEYLGRFRKKASL